MALCLYHIVSKLIALCRDCFSKLVIHDLQPALSLISLYSEKPFEIMTIDAVQFHFPRKIR